MPDFPHFNDNAHLWGDFLAMFHRAWRIFYTFREFESMVAKPARSLGLARVMGNKNKGNIVLIASHTVSGISTGHA